MKRIVLTALFLMLASCSEDKAAIDLLPDLTGTGGEGVDLVAKALPTDVPPASGPYTYFGKQRLVPDQSMEFNLIDGGPIKVVDFEITPTTQATFQLEEFNSFYVGQCPDSVRFATWYTLDENGMIIAASNIDIFETYTIPAETRGLLRLEFHEAQTCQQIYSTLIIETF